jgi:hypothetical protein
MRYKTVACILLILSIFSFVLPTPIPVREVREARADAVEGGENVKIVSGKRAPPGNPYDGDSSDSESDLFSLDLSDAESRTHQPQSPSAPDYASGSHPGVDMPPSPSAPDYASGSHPGVDMPPSPSSGSKSPPESKLWSTPGGTEVPLDEGTTTENQPASSSKPKSVSWGHTTKVHIYENEPDTPDLPAPPGREGYLAKVAGQQSPLPEVEHAPLSSYFDPSPPPAPQSKGLVSNFKTFFGKLGKLKFRPRFQHTVDTEA